jgi:DNA-binding cell septation regulator SpoVG
MSQLQLECKVRLFNSVQGNREVLGFADLVIAGAFVIKDIGIIRTDARPHPFLSFPSKKGTGQGEGKYFDVAHPITSEAHKKATELVLAEYEKAAK